MSDKSIVNPGPRGAPEDAKTAVQAVPTDQAPGVTATSPAELSAEDLQAVAGGACTLCGEVQANVTTDLGE